MIKFDQVTKIYPPENTVLKDLSFEIQAGEFVCLVGKSGVGKTTIIRLILGLEKATYGNVFFDGKNVNGMESAELQKMRRRIGSIYQDYKLLAKETVYENVAYLMQLEGRENKEIAYQVPLVLQVVGLEHKHDSFPHELSGGEQQRLAIARAIANRPDVILADEPTGNLDPYNEYEVISLLQKFNADGATVVLATHKREIVNKLNKRVLTLENGKIVRDEAQGKFMI